MSTFLLPRHFVDTEVPIYKGKPLHRIDHQIESDFYLSWLANHLYREDVAVTCDVDLNERRLDAIGLGMVAFYHFLYCYETLERMFLDGASYEEAYEIIKSYNEEIYADETDIDMIELLEDCISPLIWENAKREFEESRNLESDYADMGYREELRAILENVSSHEDRVEILRAFFVSYNEESLK